MTLPRDIDISLLRAFVAVARSGSISTAARQLHITQGGLSQQIKRLEAFFDCPLLERDPRGSRLTERGAALLAPAQHLLSLNDALYQSMQPAHLAQRVRVGVPYEMAGAHFAPVLKAFAQRYPQVEVALVTGSSLDLLADFANGRVDLTISQCPVADAQGERLAVDALVWVVAPAQGVPSQPVPLCFVTPTCTFRQNVFRLLSQADIPWKVVFENASVEATLATVRSGLAVTCWLRSLVPDDLQVLPAQAGLPALPDFAIELTVSARAPVMAQAMAELIRAEYAQGRLRLDAEVLA
ncbi:MAG: LysR family transcriptional regulator [Pseudomonas sp.]|uniref:LysR family transcriptional regulator n=1 Tax=Pseudomonas sp. TaxID=306 RepID=UPI0030F22859